MKRFWLLLLLALPLFAGCHKPETPEQGTEEEKTPEETTPRETQKSVEYVNVFGYNVMSVYYLWNEEISNGLSSWGSDWKTEKDPIARVRTIRYKDSAGKDIDRWTMMTDDFESFTSSVAGVELSVGLDFILMYLDSSHTQIVGIVTFTYANSPAEKAGLKRGDVITKLNGSAMYYDNYYDLLMSSIYGDKEFKLSLYDGRTMTLTPVELEEDAVNEVKVLDVGGKKVGYIHFTSFTLLSLKGLMQAFAGFKAEGIEELVMDLRYNGGGYVKTCNVLGSIIAPLDAVNGKKVFSREIMNRKLTDAWGEEPTNFNPDFGAITVSTGTQVDCPAAEVNSDLKRVYFLVSPDSASASESLICGLKPYMDVVVIGEQTHGKFCAGFMMDAEGWYEDVKDQLERAEYEKAVSQVKNWGLYVMYARYADCNGVTLSMPDGIVPDIEQRDDPQDGCLLGDPNETLLSIALAHMNGTYTKASTRSADPLSSLVLPASEKPHRPGYGVLVNDLPRK